MDEASKVAMHPEHRKKLEEMAREAWMEGPTPTELAIFMAGAQVAWELATKAERERCAKEVRKAAKEWEDHEDIERRILNPKVPG